MEEKLPRINITLYPPNGEPEFYQDCEIIGSLMPEIDFKGTYVYAICGVDGQGEVESFTRRRAVHITACTLPYKIEQLTDVVK